MTCVRDRQPKMLEMLLDLRVMKGHERMAYGELFGVTPDLINMTDEDTFSPMMWVTDCDIEKSNGDSAMALRLFRLLISGGADVCSMDERGENMLPWTLTYMQHGKDSAEGEKVCAEYDMGFLCAVAGQRQFVVPIDAKLSDDLSQATVKCRHHVRWSDHPLFDCFPCAPGPAVPWLCPGLVLFDDGACEFMAPVSRWVAVARCESMSHSCCFCALLHHFPICHGDMLCVARPGLPHSICCCQPSSFLWRVP